MGWASREYTARLFNDRSEQYCWFRAPSRWTFIPEPLLDTKEWREWAAKRPQQPTLQIELPAGSKSL